VIVKIKVNREVSREKITRRSVFSIIN